MEGAVSQVFIAIDAAALDGGGGSNQTVDAVVDDLHAAGRLPGAEAVRYPGEGMLQIRRDSLANGVCVDEGQFAALCAM
jgi:LDH2 family malate/lactate/ureidoglycolate dehydrogenase